MPTDELKTKTRVDNPQQDSASLTPRQYESGRHLPPKHEKPLQQGSDILYPQEWFIRALARERSLTLRLGHCFSLLELDIEPASTHHHPAHVLSQHVSQRIRETDIAGWMSATRLGIILADTSPSHAHGLARALTELVAEHHVIITHRIVPCQPILDQASSTNPQQTEAGTTQVDALLFARVPRWKRMLDIIIASLAILALSPLLLLIAVAIKVVSPGPVLFRQKRIGLLGQPYTCWKFRSMRPHADQSQHQTHVTELMHNEVPLTKLDQGEGDNRLIPFGRAFRASGLDELPQLFNVLSGEMSLVGPRPCMPYEYDEFCSWQRDRCMTPPGLTGLWQVSGKNKTTFAQMMRLDIRYIHHRSLPRDLWMMLRTPLVVFSQLGDCSHRVTTRTHTGPAHAEHHAPGGIQ